MIINYYPWGIGRDTKLKKDVGEDSYSPPATAFRTAWQSLLFVIALFFLQPSFAQSTIQIGSGTSTNTQMPIYTCYGYNYTQQIVTAAEYSAGGGIAGNITKLRFYYDNGGTTFANWNAWTVYLGHTSKTSFTSNTDWVPAGSLTQVFSGTITPVAANWFEITFSAPFNYDGTSNLVVAVDENVAGWSCTAAFRSYSGGSTRAIYYYSDDTNPDPLAPPTASGTISTLAQIQFVGTAASCLAPLTATVTPSGFTSANFAWDSASGAVGYDWEVRTSGAAGSGATGLVASGSTASLSASTSSLSAFTNYTFYVRTNCGTSTSSWRSVSFATNYCTPAPNSVDGSGITNVSFGTINNTTSSEAGNYGNYSAQSSSHVQGETVPVNITYATGYTYDTKIWIDWNNDLDFNDAGEEVYSGTSTATNPTTLNASFTVPVSASLGAHRVRIGGVDTGPPTPCYNLSWGSFEDYTINVTAPPTTPPNCVASSTPANGASNVVRDINIGWSAATGFPTSYNVYFGTSPTPAFIGNYPSSTLSYEPGDLLANTTYYYQIVPQNANGTAAGCQVNSFTTGAGFTIIYCNPVYTTGKTSGDLISNISIAGTTLSNNSGTAPVNPAYTYFTGQPNYTASLQAGSSYVVSASVGSFGDQHMAAWIDYDDDGVFESNERIGFTSGPIAGNGSTTFNISLACNPPLGLHRMRIRDVYATAGNTIDPCATYSWGETEDYDVTITAPDPCPMPTLLSAANIGSDSADLSWTIGCAETGWEVVVQLATEGAPTGSGTAVSSTTYEATGLTPETAYEYYVRAVCEEGVLNSNWAGPFAFSTTEIAPDCATLVAPADGSVDFAPVNGVINFSWTPAATGTPADSYDLYIGTASGALTFITNTTETDVDITGFSYGTQYFWSVVPVNTGGGPSGCAEFDFTTPPVPANDICTGATSLDALTSPLSDTTVGFNANFVPPCSTTSTAPDRFYSITVPTGYTLEMSQANTYDSVHSAFYGDCTSNTLISCTDDPDETEVSWTNTTGSTQTVYWVQGGYNTGAGQFTLSWNLIPPAIEITSFDPASVCTNDVNGATVTLTGLYFTGATQVLLGTESLAFNVINDTTLEVTLTAASQSGTLTVNSAVSTGTSVDQLEIIQSPEVLPIQNGNTSICQGSTVDLDNFSFGGTWSSSDESVATIDGDGIVTGIMGGTATITYTVEDFGCTSSTTTTITVDAPIVSTNPGAATVVTGTDAEFTVTASGDVQGYQWMVSTDGGDTFTNVSDGALYSGATTATLTINSTPDTLNENLYMVIVYGTASCGNFESAPAILNVGDTGIATDPSNVTLCSTGNGTAVFNVVGSGAVDSYSWEEDQGLGFMPIADGTYGDVTYSGTSTSQLTVSGLSTLNSGWAYRAVLTGPANSATSNAALLTVAEGLTIDTNPVNASNCYTGGSAVFTVGATGTVNGYQWQYSTDGVNFANVANGTPAGASYTGATSNSLTVTTTSATPAAGTYFYRANILGDAACGNIASADAQLSIFTPAITSQPVAATVTTGSVANFTVATSAPGATYQWQYATAVGGPYTNVVDGTPAGITYTNATGATLSVNVSGTAAASNQRYYRAIVTSNGCSVTSAAAQLTVVSYCTPAPGSQDGNGIVNFTMGTINNTTGSEAGYYGNYTALSTNVTQLASVPFSVTYATGYTYGTKIWIDLNRDGDFVDAGEEVYYGLSSSANPTTLSGSITVPLTSVTGPTRLRIGGTDNDAGGTPCYTGSWGSYEDYTVNIIAAPTCSGAPVAGTISSNIQSICGTGSVTLTATGYSTGIQGISLQWYNSASGLIAGATGATYTTGTLSSPQSFFLRVTCSASGQSSDSNIVSIGVDNPTVVSTTPNARCGNGTVGLAAQTSSNVAIWYSSATGGTPLYVGTNYTTPSIAASTTYYVSAATASPLLSNNTYCAATFSDATGVYRISSVTTTGGNANISNTNSGLSATGYGNFTGTHIARVNPGTSLGFNVVVSGGTMGINIWVDLNRDGDFDDAGEKLYGSNGYVSSAASSIAIPANTPAGYYRMRVRADYLNTNPPTCTASTYGETEDYTLVVGVCESARTAVTATVNTPPALTLSQSAIGICAGSSSSVVNISSNVADYDTYVWSPATGVSGSAAAGYTFNPSATTTYTLTASQSAGSLCQAVTTLTVTVNQVPSAIVITPSSTTVCSNGAPVMLVASGGTNSGSGTIGTGTGANTSTTYPTPYGAYYENVKSQYLIRASELTAAGFGAGTAITSLSFNVTSLAGAGMHENYTLSIGNTSQTALATWATGLTTVFGPVNYQPVAGNNTHAFSTPFVWNGTSNIVVQICHTNDAVSGPADYTNNAIVSNTTTAFNSSLTYNVDNSDACGNATIPATSTLRPNMTFNYNNQNAVTWSPVAGLFTNAAGTTPYTGGAALTVYAKPTSATTYTAAVTSPAGCPRSNTVAISTAAALTLYADADGDGYGNPEVSIESCPQAGYVTNNTDCNDAVATINPGMSEVLYNGVDDNCNGVIDDNNQLLSQVTPGQCGTTLTTISSLISATTFNNSTGYRFEVTNTSTGAVQVIDRPLQWFSLTMLPQYDYATTYSIRVMVQRNGVWLGYYGPACQVSSPAILDAGGAAQISASQCGITLATINTLIATNSIPNTTGYRFRVTNLTDSSAPNQVQTIDRTLHWFALTMLPTYTYGTTYLIEVAVKTNGDYSGYGSPCTISTPAVPTLTNCGATIATSGTLISTVNKSNTTSYRFEITNLSNNIVTTIDRPNHWFSFNMVPGYAPNTQYGVRVALMTSGVYSLFGDACVITSPGAAREGEVKETIEPFKAVAYPNPFAEGFGIHMTNPAEALVSVKVYDMTGRMLSEDTVTGTALESLKLGAAYPAGVYNVVVSQGENVSTLRVVKR